MDNYHSIAMIDHVLVLRREVHVTDLPVVPENVVRTDSTARSCMYF